MSSDDIPQPADPFSQDIGELAEYQSRKEVSGDAAGYALGVLAVIALVGVVVGFGVWLIG